MSVEFACRLLGTMFVRRGVWALVALIVLVLSPSFAADEHMRTLVMHDIRAIVRIPADWTYQTHTLGSYFGTDYLGSGDERLHWGHAIWQEGMSLESLCTYTVTRTADFVGSGSTLQYIEAGGQPGCVISPNENQPSNIQNQNALIVHHATPFESPVYGHIEYLLFMVDKAHFDGIVESLDFAPEHTTPNDYLASLLDIVQAESFYRDKIDWDVLRKTELDNPKNKTDLSTVGVPITHIVDALRNVGDNHTLYIAPNLSEQIFSDTPGVTDTLSDVSFPTGRRLTTTVGYIEIPGLLSGLNVARQFARAGQDVIRQLDADPVSCWVVDLRHNSGGNLFPMLAVVAPLLGNGRLLYFTRADGTVDGSVFLLGGKLISNGNELSEQYLQEPYRLQQPFPAVALLVGGKTASAGEYTAIAFMGRPNTRLFGQLSGGYTTFNSGTPLFDGGLLALASAATADRHGAQYLDGITPDEIIEEDTNGADSLDNPAITAALEWLREYDC